MNENNAHIQIKNKSKCHFEKSNRYIQKRLKDVQNNLSPREIEQLIKLDQQRMS